MRRLNLAEGYGIVSAALAQTRGETFPTAWKKLLAQKGVIVDTCQSQYIHSIGLCAVFYYSCSKGQPRAPSALLRVR